MTSECLCRDCFEIVVCDDLSVGDMCPECTEYGCDDTGQQKCNMEIWVSSLIGGDDDNV